MHVIIVTGLSGAGKSTALRALEDCRFYCVDNIPLPMADQLVDWLAGAGDVSGVALAVDARQHRHLSSYRGELDRLAAKGHELDVLYLEASEETLVRRFSATRRSHPLSQHDLVAGIRGEAEILAELRAISNVIDTGSLNVHQLKAIIQDRYGHGEAGLSVVLLSFGFKYGIPKESNLLFDVRFLPNPYFDPTLTDHDGRDGDVSAYVLKHAEAKTMLEHIENLLRFNLPLFEKERKLYLTVAVGCTGGRHRSVAIVEELYRRFKPDWDVLVKHRDLDLRT